MGFPGRTNRYRSSFGVNEIEKVTNPVSVKMRDGKLKIMNSFMEQNPKTRLVYADNYFSISNVQEYQAGEIYNFRRYGVVGIKAQEEAELQQWIDKDPERKAKYSDLLKKLEDNYNAVADITNQKKYFQETMVAGNGFVFLANRVNSLQNALNRQSFDTLFPGWKRA